MACESKLHRGGIVDLHAVGGGNGSAQTRFHGAQTLERGRRSSPGRASRQSSAAGRRARRAWARRRAVEQRAADVPDKPPGPVTGGKGWDAGRVGGGVRWDVVRRVVVRVFRHQAPQLAAAMLSNRRGGSSSHSPAYRSADGKQTSASRPFARARRAESSTQRGAGAHAGEGVGCDQAAAVGGNLAGRCSPCRRSGPGLPQASASATAMPKFSWCEGRMKASAAWKAPHLALPQQHPGPVDSLGDASRLGWALQLSAPVLRVWAGHHQIEGRVSRHQLHKGVYQQIAAFFAIDPAEEEKKAATAERGADGEERLPLRSRVAGRRNGAEGDDMGIPAVQPEALFGESGLGFAGEEHMRPRHAAPSTPPAASKATSSYVSWECSFEVGIEHSMSEDDIGHASADGAPDGVSQYCHIPWTTTPSKRVRLAWSQGMSLRLWLYTEVLGPVRAPGEWEFAQKWCIGPVQGHHLIACSLGASSVNRHAHGLRRSRRTSGQAMR